MVEIDNIDREKLEKAVVVWTGYESEMCPTREDCSVVDAFSKEEAALLLQEIKVLEDEFYKSDAHITAANHAQMRDQAVADFKRMYPNLPEKISAAFGWCYSFDHR